MKYRIALVGILLLIMTVSLVLVACDPPEEMLTVTFYDGTTVIDAVEVPVGGKVDRLAPPEKAGYNFINWFATPSKNHRFKFENPITEDVSIYAGYSQYQEDDRDFFVVGSGTSKLLITQNWGVGINDTHKLTKHATKNEYTITCDLMAGDEFQFAITATWHNKRGYGYIEQTKLADNTVVFEGTGGGYGEVSSKAQNIKVKLDGNYTFTLSTYPLDDYYNTADPTYSEAGKEVYNTGTYDTITWTRNGDPIDPIVVVTKYYIKGAGITAWKDMWNSAGELVKQEDGTYKLVIFLKANEEFVFTSTNSSLGNTSAGTEYIRTTAVDDSSKALFDLTSVQGNIKALAEGTYTFGYNAVTKKLTATVDTLAKPQERDYYIDGTFLTGGWGTSLYGTTEDRTKGEITCTCDPVNANHISYKFINDYKLTETAPGSGIFRIMDVTLPAGAEVIIQSYKKDSTEPGLWGQDGYNQLGTYNASYLLGQLTANDNFEMHQYGNIVVKTAGTYNIVFDSYSKVVSISNGIDVYIKGAINGWSHGYKSEYLMVRSETNIDMYELTVTFALNDSFDFAKYDKGSKIDGDLGAFLNKTTGGTEGVTAKFVPASGNDFTASEAGTFKIVYNSLTGQINFYTTD